MTEENPMPTTVYRAECVDDDGNRRIIRTENKKAAAATAAYWQERPWAHEVSVTEERS